MIKDNKNITDFDQILATRYDNGSLFMEVSTHFCANLFYYVYVLTYYEKARKDIRFIEALAALKRKLDDQGRMIVEPVSYTHLTLPTKRIV